MIEFSISIAEYPESKLIELVATTKDAPEATAGEINTAKAFEVVLAAFKDQMALNGKKPSVLLPKSRIIHN